jgi:microsomal prostaglandin-E synthase 2
VALSLPEAVLYQFALCPFCNKVRAGLELKGIRYRTVEVNPRNKAGLPELPADAPRKVPVLVVGDQVVHDSTTILRFLDDAYPDTVKFRPEPQALRARADEIEDWVDEELVRALPTVMYGTWREAGRAAAVVARGSKLNLMQDFGVKVAGPVIMHLVAKRLLKKSGRADAHAWVNESLDQLESWLGEQPFLCGPVMTIADVAVLGVFACVEEFPIYDDITARPRLKAWLARMADKKAQAKANYGRAIEVHA